MEKLEKRMIIKLFFLKQQKERLRQKEANVTTNWKKTHENNDSVT